MTSKAVKRTPHNYSVSRNIRQNRDNMDKALLLFGSAEVTGPIPVSSLVKSCGNLDIYKVSALFVCLKICRQL